MFPPFHCQKLIKCTDELVNITHGKERSTTLDKGGVGKYVRKMFEQLECTTGPVVPVKSREYDLISQLMRLLKRNIEWRANR